MEFCFQVSRFWNISDQGEAMLDRFLFPLPVTLLLTGFLLSLAPDAEAQCRNGGRGYRGFGLRLRSHQGSRSRGPTRTYRPWSVTPGKERYRVPRSVHRTLSCYQPRTYYRPRTYYQPPTYYQPSTSVLTVSPPRMVYSVIPSQAAGSTPLSSSLPAQPEAHTPPTPKRESEVPLEEPLSPVFAPLELGLAALRRGQYLSARRNLEKAYARTGSRQALMALMLARLASADARGASLLGRIVVSNAGARPVRLQWDPVVLLPSEETFASLVGDLERSAGSSADQHFLAGLLWFTAQQPAAARGAFRRVLALAPDDGQSKAFDAKIQHGITVAYSQENWKALAGLLGQAKTTALQRAVSDRAATQVRIEAAKRELSLLHDRRRRARQRLMVELVALRAELNQGRIEPLAYVKQRDRLSSAWEVEQSKIALEKGAVLAAIEQGQQKLTTLNEVVSTLLTD